MLNVAGRSIRVAPAGRWVAALPAEERVEQFETHPELAEEWDDEWGDRGTRLVVIGTEMDHESIRDRLERCLLTAEEMEADWEAFDDRFPTFEAAEEATEDETESPENDGQEEIGIAD